jgi:prepilin-type N-terminal cleavage/methylation domain-containing protein
MRSNPFGAADNMTTGRTTRNDVSSLRRGFTLVEIMIAVLVIAILAIGGAAIIFRSRADIVVQQFKRAAIECANQQMEKLMRDESWGYTNLATRVGMPDLVETVGLNGITNFTMRTSVSNGVDGCLAVTVSVQYGRKAGDTVELQTLRSQ